MAMQAHAPPGAESSGPPDVGGGVGTRSFPFHLRVAPVLMLVLLTAGAAAVVWGLLGRSADGYRYGVVALVVAVYAVALLGTGLLAQRLQRTHANLVAERTLLQRLM